MTPHDFNIAFKEAVVVRHLAARFPRTLKTVIVEHDAKTFQQIVKVQFRNGREVKWDADDYQSDDLLATCILINDLH